MNGEKKKTRGLQSSEAREEVDPLLVEGMARELM